MLSKKYTNHFLDVNGVKCLSWPKSEKIKTKEIINGRKVETGEADTS